MRYLSGSLDTCLTYTGTGDCKLIGNCDSDWGGDEEQRRSTSGYVFLMNNGPIAWCSRLQKTTALSVTEAEYMSLAEALTECLWLRPFLKSLGYENQEPTVIRTDNQAAIHLSRNPEFHRRTKHVGIRYHRVRQEQEQGTGDVKYVQTDMNPSDCLTKGVSSGVLDKNLNLMNMTS